jgi:hypothetical protein
MASMLTLHFDFTSLVWFGTGVVMWHFVDEVLRFGLTQLNISSGRLIDAETVTYFVSNTLFLAVLARRLFVAYEYDM